MTINQDGTILAAASDSDNYVRLFDMQDGQMIAEVPIYGGTSTFPNRVASLNFDPLGKYLCVAFERKPIVHILTVPTKGDGTEAPCNAGNISLSWDDNGSGYEYSLKETRKTIATVLKGKIFIVTASG
jgi:hypothetical protein